jgi:Holliday junction DNA helicase RuvA
LATAVAAGDLATLQRVPGIGRKGASRLVLELAGKLAVDDAGPHRAGSGHPVRGEVSAALVALGYSASAAEDALDAVFAEEGTPSSTPEVLRAALRTLGARRG